MRILDLTEADLRPFRLGREGGPVSLADVLGGAAGTPRDDQPIDQGAVQLPPRTQAPVLPVPPAPAVQTPFPQPLQGALPGTMLPLQTPPKKPGGGGS